NPKEQTRWYKLDYKYSSDDKVFYKTSHRKFTSKINHININDDFMYLLGYWLGDGWLNKNTRYEKQYGLKYSRWDICVDKKNQPFIDKIKNVLSNLGLDYETSYGLKNDKKQSSTLNFYIKDPLFCEWWYDNFGAHCDDKRIPEWVLELPQNKLKHLLAGIIDSDGCIYKNIIEISLVNENLIHQIFDLFICLKQLPNIGYQLKKGVTPSGKYYETMMHIITVFNCDEIVANCLKSSRYDKTQNKNFGNNSKFMYENDDLYYRIEKIKK
ncbi:hypothetical protein LCGC14_2471840, partial [marine sediment metagenome]